MTVRLLSEMPDKCEAEGCDQPPIMMVYSENQNKVLFCCDDHACRILDEAHPEYWETCPNCGCDIPVNCS